MANILIVEDDMDIAQGIAEFLEPKGFQLDFAYTGKQAIALLETNQYQLVLLDINLPFVNGYDVCRHLSNDSLGQYLSSVPVIMMSSRSHEQDIMRGFESGAWDYLKKPFTFSELLARINVGLLKSKHTSLLNQTTDYNGAYLDENAFTLSYENKTVQLHQIGFDILKLLISHAPNVVKTSVIHQHLWPEETPESDPLRANIYKLRKLLVGKFDQDFIKTVKGVGYKFEVLSETDIEKI